MKSISGLDNFGKNQTGYNRTHHRKADLSSNSTITDGNPFGFSSTRMTIMKILYIICGFCFGSFVLIGAVYLVKLALKFREKRMKDEGDVKLT